MLMEISARYDSMLIIKKMDQKVYAQQQKKKKMEIKIYVWC